VVLAGPPPSARQSVTASARHGLNPAATLIEVAVPGAAEEGGPLGRGEHQSRPGGMPGIPQRHLAVGQVRDLLVANAEDEAVALVARTRIWTLAESLGGVESLIEHPGRMTHASTADAPFAAPRNLIRLSVGIESAEDLIEDLELALVRSTAAAGA